MDSRFIISSSPHLRTSEDTSKIMKDVIIALLPATIGAIYFFRLGAVITIVSCVLAAVISEFLMQKALNKKVTINDYSAVVTGLLLAFNLPASAPWWLGFVGSVFAIVIVKQVFGGLGHNFMNPALAARAMLLASWPVQMTSWVKPGVDAVSTVTPLAAVKGIEGSSHASIMDLFLGNVGGCIGETSALLLLIGAAYLLYKRVITYTIPMFYMATVFVITFAFGGYNVLNSVYHIFAGGLILGAFYMATDYASSPVTHKGQIIYAIGCGVITSVIRLWGGYPEGVSYSILLMNVAAPLIDKYTSPRVFGEVSK